MFGCSNNFQIIIILDGGIVRSNIPLAAGHYQDFPEAKIFAANVY